MKNFCFVLLTVVLALGWFYVAFGDSECWGYDVIKWIWLFVFGGSFFVFWKSLMKVLF